MAINTFYPFGLGGGANILTKTQYDALPARINGFQTGVANSTELNTVWRQATAMSHAIGQLMVDYGIDALDDGNVPALVDNLENFFGKVSNANELVVNGNTTLPPGFSGTVYCSGVPSPSPGGDAYAIILPRANSNGGKPFEITFIKTTGAILEVVVQGASVPITEPVFGVPRLGFTLDQAGSGFTVRSDGAGAYYVKSKTPTVVDRQSTSFSGFSLVGFFSYDAVPTVAMIKQALWSGVQWPIRVAGTNQLPSGANTRAWLEADVSGTPSMHGIYAAIDNLSSPSTLTFGSAIRALSGASGPRDNTVQFDVSGANTTYGIRTNGAIFTASGVTTSDKRTKRNIVAFEKASLKAAIELQKKIVWHSFDKLIDQASILAIQKETNTQGANDLTALEKSAADLNGDGLVTEEEIAEFQKRKAEHDLKVQAAVDKKDAVYDVSDKALLLGKQAGVIAQELQALTKQLGDFEWLVKRSIPSDKESVLVVDYNSLYAILEAATQERLRLLEAKA
jgi:hypothetical protein